MTLEQIVIKLYEVFWSKVNETNYKFDPEKASKGRAIKQIENFLIAIHKEYGVGTIGPHWMIDYFCFQWNYWYTLRDRVKLNSLVIPWIIGPKALERWNDRHRESYQYYYRKGILTKFNISELWLEEQLYDHPTETDGLSEAEEREKLYFTGEHRLIHCSEHTTLFNPKSPICIECSEKDLCKKLLLEKSKEDALLPREIGTPYLDAVVARGFMKIEKNE